MLIRVQKVLLRKDIRVARFSDAGSVPPLPIGLVGFGGSSLRVGKSKLVLVTFKIGDKSGRSCRICRATGMIRGARGEELAVSRLECRVFLGRALCSFRLPQ